MPRLPRRNKEQKMFDALYYVIEHPLCHKTQIVQSCGLSCNSRFVWDLYSNGYITNYHVKSLRKNCNIIGITKKGIDYVYERKNCMKATYKP